TRLGAPGAGRRARLRKVAALERHLDRLLIQPDLDVQHGRARVPEPDAAALGENLDGGADVAGARPRSLTGRVAASWSAAGRRRRTWDFLRSGRGLGGGGARGCGLRGGRTRGFSCPRRGRLRRDVLANFLLPGR